MNFEDFDRKMRKFEESVDEYIPSDVFMVARLDGHKFSKKTIDLGYKKPFDIDFHHMMQHILTTLMKESGFKIIYGYTQSDEISLLFAQNEQAFNRKTRKYNSLLAADASAEASLYLQKKVVFDCRMIPLPTIDDVYDYFLWRQEDSYRNSINGYCYWTSRNMDKMSPRKTTSLLNQKDMKWKYEFLKDHNIHFNMVPAWQRFGCGMAFHKVTKHGYNPITKETHPCVRRVLETFDILPTNNAYTQFLIEIIDEQ